MYGLAQRIARSKETFNRACLSSPAVPFADNGGNRREHAVVYRAGFSNQADSLALRPWNKSNNLTHVRSYCIIIIIPNCQMAPLTPTLKPRRR
jgi:hypothetical protein